MHMVVACNLGNKGTFVTTFAPPLTYGSCQHSAYMQKSYSRHCQATS